MEHNESNDKAQAFLEYTIASIVDHPEAVKVERKVDDMGVLMTLRVHPEDMGKVIGRSGKTAQAIRILLRVVGMKNHAHVSLTIEEPNGGQRPAPFSGPARSEPAPILGRSAEEALEDLKAL